MTSVLFQSIEPPAHLCPFCSGFWQNGTSEKERRVSIRNLLFVLIIAVTFLTVTFKIFV